jgi:hypothetical protein
MTKQTELRVVITEDTTTMEWEEMVVYKKNEVGEEKEIFRTKDGEAQHNFWYYGRWQQEVP